MKYKLPFAIIVLAIAAAICVFLINRPEDKSSASKAQVQEQHVIIVFDNISIRKTADDEGEILTATKKNDSFPLLKKEGNWYKVSLSDGQEGYVPILFSSLVISNSNSFLKGKTIVLDAGHGGKDNGATGVKGTLEKTLTIKTVGNIQQQLEKLGATVVLTRSDDTYIPLEDRAEAKGDIFISIHYDSSKIGSARGVTVYYFKEPMDKPLAASMCNALLKMKTAPQRGMFSGNFKVLRTNKNPSILIELGFLSNQEDEKLVKTDEFQEEAVKNIVDGITSYFYK